MSELAVVKQDEQSLPASAPDTSSVMSMVERIMSDPNISVERVNMAFDFYQKVEADRARKAFDAAMAAAKSEIPPIIKTRVVDFTSQKGRTNYRHEDLAGIAKVIDPILGRHGLSYRFRTTSEPNQPISVTCIVSHRLGYSEENTLLGGRDESGNKNSIQAIGSTITYLQRYTLKAALGLAASHDDDGRQTEEPEFINEAQIVEIEALLKSTGTAIEKYLEFTQLPELCSMPAKDFAKRRDQLLKKKRKLEGGA